MKKKNQILYKKKSDNLMFGTFTGLLACMFYLIGWYEVAAISTAVSLPLTFIKDGLDGDNLKMVEFLNTRFSKLNLDVLSKEEIELIVRSAVSKFDGIDISKLKEFTQDDDKGIRSILLAQGTEIEKLKAGQKNAPEDLSVRAQVAKWMEANKDAIEGVKNGKRADLPSLHLRAPITMTNGTSLGGSVYLPNAMVQPGSIDLNRTEPTFWQRLVKGVTKANPFVWVNKTNKQGNAQFIGEGVLKPLASFELASESSTPKKVAERMKVSTEMLYDIDGMTSMIEQELKYEVEVAANAAVLTGVASSTNPKGVTAYAALFTLTSVKTTTPNNLDAIRAAVAQLKLLNFVNGIVAFINPIDAANMDLSKGVDGHYILPPFTTADGRAIAGITIVEDLNIAQGFLLIGDMSKYRVFMYQDFHVTWGWENDDLSRNLMTVVGEMRFHQWVSANHAGAFIYDTFANIKTAITA